ncbi:uncharacterized protein LOC130745238 [Lotus japonicus]|uniref:uncharacterized protein LOC130745238 n=1 Tax=Lotus japonicus TaxID=34305 RepID=UPI0025838698|nr:uncharacterized protein LOC130745238 [Lotus japonicus]
MSNGWNLEVLYTVLPHDVASQLQRMKPQLVPNHQDLWVWESSDSGCYTVKDGYTWLANRLQQDVTLEDWRWLLRLKIPERIRIFICLVVHNSIQTNLYRFRCNIAASPSCTRCSAPEEDAIHCLRDYLYSRELWMRASALSWPGFLQNGCDAWEGPWTVDVAWRRLCYEHDEIKKVLSGDAEQEDGNWMARRWQPPPAGAFSSYNPAGKFMGSGGLIRNHQGHWVCGFHSYLAGGSVLLAEARALKLGLQIAREQGICNSPTFRGHR